MGTQPSTFGTEHFGAADLGDRRRTNRLVQIAGHPGDTLPEKFGDLRRSRRCTDS